MQTKDAHTLAHNQVSILDHPRYFVKIETINHTMFAKKKKSILKEARLFFYKAYKYWKYCFYLYLFFTFLV